MNSLPAAWAQQETRQIKFESFIMKYLEILAEKEVINFFSYKNAIPCLLLDAK